MAATSVQAIAHPRIPGLFIYYDYLDSVGEQTLIDYIMSQPWPVLLAPGGAPMKRKTQHYGYYYSYSAKSTSEVAPPITGPLEVIRKNLADTLGRPFNQIIINLYERNQGISAHIDKLDYGDLIITISLAADTIMTFSRDGVEVNIYLPRRSMVIMSGDARYKWYHAISDKISPAYLPVADASDPRYAGKTAPRDADCRRISITVRHKPT